MKSISLLLLALAFAAQRTVLADALPTTNAGPRILIEAVVFEVTLPKTRKAGHSKPPEQKSFATAYLQDGSARWHTNLTQIAATNATSLQKHDELNYVVGLGSGFNATIATLVASPQHINLIAKPRIETSPGVTATFWTGICVPTSMHSRPIKTDTSLQRPDSSLAITPHLNPNGLLTLDIQTAADWLVGQTNVSNVGLIPVFESSVSQASVTATFDDVLMIGGASRNPIAKRPTRILAPKHLPAGAAPKSLQTELVILICPKLVSKHPMCRGGFSRAELQ
jgi:type II secretory pathway component GspD/PulD (secretin)